MNWRVGLKHTLLRLARLLGGFRLARAMTGDGLRVLCYHGFAINDEDEFRPALYMPGNLFAERLDLLQARGFTPLPLGQALELQDQGKLPRDAVAITIDDGWYSTLAVAAPLLAQREMPAMLYVTTYYVDKPGPVFRVCIAYLFWKSKLSSADFTALGIPALAASTHCDLLDEHDRDAAQEAIIEHGERNCDEPGRMALTRRVAEALQVDYDRVYDSRMLSLVDRKELAALQEAGVQLELHTHRHRLPVSPAACGDELKENRAVLEPLAGRALAHFCYPSGDWQPEHLPLLEAEGVVSATTCEPGFVYRDTPRLKLNRFLDHAHISQLEFEAELSGIKELYRRLRAGRQKTGVATW